MENNKIIYSARLMWPSFLDKFCILGHLFSRWLDVLNFKVRIKWKIIRFIFFSPKYFNFQVFENKAIFATCSEWVYQSWFNVIKNVPAFQQTHCRLNGLVIVIKDGSDIFLASRLGMSIWATNWKIQLFFEQWVFIFLKHKFKQKLSDVSERYGNR